MKTVPLVNAAKSHLPSEESRMALFGSVTIFCVAIPGFASSKGLIILATWVYLLTKSRLQIRSVLWFISVLGNLAVWYEVALFHRVLSADLFNHLSRLFLFFMVLSFGVMTIHLGGVDSRRLDNVIFGIACLAAMLKIGIMAIVLSGWYSLDAVQSALGFETVTDNIGLGLQRLQFPSDIILIFLIACYVGGRNKAIDLLLMLAVTVSIFLSFSRYLFAAFVLCIILRSYRAGKFDTVSRTATVLGVGILLLFSANLAERFSGEGTSTSDDTRTVQVQALTSVIVRHLTFGTGIGSSVNGFTRSNTLPFSYEVEWYAMAMQLGLFGLLWFIGNLIAPLLSSMKFAKKKAFVVLVFLIWAFAGFTNPYITSLGSAFGFCILMLSASVSADVSTGSRKVSIQRVS